jgi:hypothetical protein
MSNCNEIVLDIYNHPALLNLIAKIKPQAIQDDLRQEIAVSLLTQPCEKIAALFASNELIRYSMKICWLMATSSTSQFYYKFKKSDLTKAVEYLYSMQELPTIPEHLALRAQTVLQNKNKTVEDDHEVRIFNKFVELGTARKVALYYGIPLNHVCNVINKVKSELKCILLS